MQHVPGTSTAARTLGTGWIQGSIKLVFFAFRLGLYVGWEVGARFVVFSHDVVVADVGKFRVRAGFVGGHV